MISIDKSAALGLIVKVWPEVHTAHHMPASSVLLLIPFFDVLSCVLQVYDLAFYHQVVDVLCDLHCVVFHVDLHIAEFHIGINLDVGRESPIFGDACSSYLFVIDLLVLLLFAYIFGWGRHSEVAIFNLNITIQHELFILIFL